MAALARPHWEAVTPGARDLLTVMGRSHLLRPFYLAAGTALALRLGHPVSRDLDLFADIETLDGNLRRSIVDELGRSRAVNLLQDAPLGLVLEVDGQPVNFLSCGYPLLEPTALLGGVQIAGMLDIGLMKLDAVVGRGMRRDFYDLYFMAAHITLSELFDRSAEKYPESRGFGMRVLTALVDFEFADQQDEPTLLLPASWEEVKAFFVAESRRLAREWFGLAGAGSNR